MNKKSTPLALSAAYVTSNFHDRPGKDHLYHCPQHTLEVIAYCIEIGTESGVSGEELEILQIAAWFHDTGYDDAGYGHEEKGVVIARNFLEEINYSAKKIELITSCIRMTNLGATPSTLFEKIIRDADLAYLGTNDFKRQSNALREEWRLTRNQKFSDYDWVKGQVSFLSTHVFHTLYAQDRFQPTKLQNLGTMKELLESLSPTD